MIVSAVGIITLIVAVGMRMAAGDAPRLQTTPGGSMVPSIAAEHPGDRTEVSHGALHCSSLLFVGSHIP